MLGGIVTAAPAAAVDMPALKTNPANQVPSCATPGRLSAYLASRNPAVDRRFDGIAAHYMRHGQDLGLRWDYAFFQMMVETGNLSFRRASGQPGAVGPSQNNFAGLGATGGGEPGEHFPDVSTGVKAHLQHLALYAGDRIAHPVAERTRKVQDWGILTSWQTSLGGRPTRFGDLAAKWAPLDSGYAGGIIAVARRFFDSYCQQPDLVIGATQTPAAAAIAVAPPPVAIYAPPEPDEPAAVQAEQGPSKPSGIELARQASERAREEREPNTRWGLGMAPSIAAQQPPTRSAAETTMRVINAGGAEADPPKAEVQATPEPIAVAAASPAPAPSAAQAAPERRVAIIDRRPPQPARPATPPATPSAGTPGASPDDAIRVLISGRTVLIDAALGTSIPVIFRPDGTMRGQGGGLAFALGASTDEGRWWVHNGRLCKRWRVWLERETQCLRLRQAGAVIHWTRDDGKTGTARFVASR